MRCQSLAIVLITWCLGVALSPSLIRGADLPSSSASEILHLLAYVENAPCRFQRNGVWYDDKRAVRQHMERKMDYFLKKGRIMSAEDFIKWSATKSEITGKPYVVQCGRGEPAEVSRWLLDELARYRQAAGRLAPPVCDPGPGRVTAP